MRLIDCWDYVRRYLYEEKAFKNILKFYLYYYLVVVRGVKELEEEFRTFMRNFAKAVRCFMIYDVYTELMHETGDKLYDKEHFIRCWIDYAVDNLIAVYNQEQYLSKYKMEWFKRAYILHYKDIYWALTEEELEEIERFNDMIFRAKMYPKSTQLVNCGIKYNDKPETRFFLRKLTPNERILLDEMTFKLLKYDTDMIIQWEGIPVTIDTNPVEILYNEFDLSTLFSLVRKYLEYVLRLYAIEGTIDYYTYKTLGSEINLIEKYDNGEISDIVLIDSFVGLMHAHGHIIHHLWWIMDEDIAKTYGRIPRYDRELLVEMIRWLDMKREGRIYELYKEYKAHFGIDPILEEYRHLFFETPPREFLRAMFQKLSMF